ncbi:hypothetical protein OROMI_001145 [Orobanche minor]
MEIMWGCLIMVYIIILHLISSGSKIMKVDFRGWFWISVDDGVEFVDGWLYRYFSTLERIYRDGTVLVLALVEENVVLRYGIVGYRFYSRFRGFDGSVVTRRDSRGDTGYGIRLGNRDLLFISLL